MKVFIDSSAWVDTIKSNGKSPTGKIVTELLNSGEPIYSLPIVAQEVLQGFKSDDVQEWVDLFEGLAYLESSFEEACLAAALYRSLRRKGITVQTADAQIASACLHHNLKLLTLDQDFSRIEGLRYHQP
jgi:predicted nucleic acid-binding protein